MICGSNAKKKRKRTSVLYSDSCDTCSDTNPDDLHEVIHHGMPIVICTPCFDAWDKDELDEKVKEKNQFVFR